MKKNALFYICTMKYAFLLIILLATGFAQNDSKNTQKVQVIPLPNNIQPQPGQLQLSREIRVFFNDPHLNPLVQLFISQVKPVLNCKPTTDSSNAKLKLNLKESSGKEESYRLEIDEEGIEITAESPNGIFNGLQTLRQILQFSADTTTNRVQLPLVTIKDSPRFGWRGLMLDESRHFFGVEKVKQLIDLMAFHKLNKFHWHLTDVPGWRIEIKKYPKLTTIGAVGNYVDPNAPAQFYTQEEIKEIVNYAGAHFIEIIPEIDMPGHATAANKAYPEYSGGGSEKHPEFTFNPGKEETYAFLTEILKEISELFPSEYIHLGGDEVHFGNENWKTDEYVQQLMKHENLEDLKAVETYFVQRIADSINAIGKTIVGWDEIVDHGLNQNNSLVMWWRHNMPEKLETALEQNYTVILCPRIPLYFDFVQHDSHEHGRRWGGAFAPLNLVYAFPPDTLPGYKNHSEQIMGMQANVWTERIQNNQRLDFMVFPRISALAEAAWTQPAHKNYSNFQQRLREMHRYFDSENLYYFNPFQPSASPEPAGPGAKQN